MLSTNPSKPMKSFFVCFFESINAIGVLQLPVIISIWDDDYGISVSKKYHTTKENISKILIGLKSSKKHEFSPFQAFVNILTDKIVIQYFYVVDHIDKSKKLQML